MGESWKYTEEGINTTKSFVWVNANFIWQNIIKGAKWWPIDKLIFVVRFQQ